MAIEIKEVSSKRDLKSFVYFPFWLYNGSKFWVPPFVEDELFFFNKIKNPIYNAADSRLYLVYKDRRIAGRVAVLAKHDEVENDKKIRFGWLDFEDDKEVSTLLFEAIEESAEELKATTIEGPVGFTDRDRTGMLIDGFKAENNMTTWYNQPYYQRHIEAWGFLGAQDLVEYQLSLADKNQQEASILGKTQHAAITKSEVQKHAAKIAALFPTALTALQQFIPLKNILIFTDDNNRTQQFAAFVPNFNAALKRGNGRISLLSRVLFFRAKRKSTQAHLALNLNDEGVENAFAENVFQQTILHAKALGIKNVASLPLLHSSKTATYWLQNGGTELKRRRTFTKTIS